MQYIGHSVINVVFVLATREKLPRICFYISFTFQVVSSIFSSRFEA